MTVGGDVIREPLADPRPPVLSMMGAELDHFWPGRRSYAFDEFCR